MNYKNLLQTKSFGLVCIGIALLFYSLESNGQTSTSAAIGAYTSGTKIPKSVFSTLPAIGVHVKDVVLEIKYTVTSYTLKVTDEEGNIKQAHCQGSAFSALAKQYIKDYTKPGDMISIERILAKDESGREVRIPALVYYIE